MKIRSAEDGRQYDAYVKKCSTTIVEDARDRLSRQINAASAQFILSETGKLRCAKRDVVIRDFDLFSAREEETGVLKEVTQDIPQWSKPRLTDPIDSVLCKGLDDGVSNFVPVSVLSPRDFLIKTGMLKERIAPNLRKWVTSNKRHKTDPNLSFARAYRRLQMTRVNSDISFKDQSAAALAKTLILRVEAIAAADPQSDIPRISRKEYNDNLNQMFKLKAEKIRALQRQFDAQGLPAYFPKFVDMTAKWYSVKGPLTGNRFSLVEAGAVDRIDSHSLRELKAIWENKLKEYELDERSILSQSSSRPINVLKRTTRSKPDRNTLVERLRYSEQVNDNLGTLDEAKRTKNKILLGWMVEGVTSVEAGAKLGKRPDAMRKAKSRAFEKPSLSEDQIWENAIEKTFIKKGSWFATKDKQTNGLYALVKLRHQSPRVYFLMDEKRGRSVVAQIMSASEPSYALVLLLKAKWAAAKAVKGDPQVVTSAFESAVVRLLTFSGKEHLEDPRSLESVGSVS